MKSDVVMQKELPPPDWSKVRSIYKKLSDEFHLLTQPYGIALTPDRSIMLDHLILSIDAVDQYIDELPTRDQREDITRAIRLTFKEQEPIWQHPLATEELESHITLLKRIVLALDVQRRFAKATSRVFWYTEHKRHTTRHQDLIHLVQKEGYATGELPLSIMGIEKTHPFFSFFSRLCMLMGIADLIVDARSDYRRKYIVTKPSFILYTKLIFILIRHGLGLFLQFPAKRKFLIYTFKMIGALFIARD